MNCVMALASATPPLFWLPQNPKPISRFASFRCSTNPNNNSGNSNKVALRTCKNCKTQFDPSLNHLRACRFHSAHFGGETTRKFESVYTGGTMSTPNSGKVVQYWHCCGSEDPFDPGCSNSEMLIMENIVASLQGTLKVEVLSAVVPILMFLSMGLFGFVLAHPKYQLVPRATFTFLSKLVFVIFLPCLIFTYLGPTITLKNLLLWWFIPVNVVLSTAIGCVLGLLVALVCRPPSEYFRFTIIMTAFGNTGNLPLAIVTSICQSDDNPFGSDCYDYGVSYVSFSQWVSVILVYTLVYHMMEPPLRDQSLLVEEEDDGDEGEIYEESASDSNYENENHLSRPLLVDAEWPGIEDKETEHCKTPFIATLFNTRSSSARLSVSTIPDVTGLTEQTEGTSQNSSQCLAEPRMVRKIRSVVGMTPIHHILQPPTIASVLAIIIGMVPTLKSIVYDDDAVLAFLTDSLEILSEAMVPAAMLVLGGMLAQGPAESNLGTRTTVGIIIARLFILPLIGIGVIHLADKWNILIAGDQMFRLVLLLQYTMPSAILLGAIASLRGYAVKEASALLFWQHVVAVFSLSFYIFVYFYILF